MHSKLGKFDISRERAGATMGGDLFMIVMMMMMMMMIMMMMTMTRQREQELQWEETFSTLAKCKICHQNLSQRFATYCIITKYMVANCIPISTDNFDLKHTGAFELRVNYAGLNKMGSVTYWRPIQLKELSNSDEPNWDWIAILI